MGSRQRQRRLPLPLASPSHCRGYFWRLRPNGPRRSWRLPHPCVRVYHPCLPRPWRGPEWADPSTGFSGLVALPRSSLRRPPHHTLLAPSTMPPGPHGAHEAKPRSWKAMPDRVRTIARLPTVGSPRPPLLRLLRSARRRLRDRPAWALRPLQVALPRLGQR